MNPIYHKYKERFIQISGNNRSLFVKGIVKKYNFDIGAIMENRNDTDEFTEFLWHERRSFSLINDKVVSKMLRQASKSDSVVDVADSLAGEEVVAADEETTVTVKKAKSSKAKLSDKSDHILATQLGNLKYLKREVEEVEKETGLYDLFIGYPFVVGNLSDDIRLRAPLLLFPAHINLEQEEATLTLTSGQPVMLNKAFLLAYAKEHNIPTDKLIQEFDPLAEDSFDSPCAVIDYLNSNGFKLRTTRRKSLQAFDVGGMPLEGLEIRNYALIGKFPMANAIYNDYLALEKDDLTTPSIDALLMVNRGKKREGCFADKRKARAERSLKKSKESTINSYYPINDLDYAQENALVEISRRDNIVVYGPPGTGKSQTIVNIISDALCKKKRVLVVSQKRAALDVVYSRLGKLNAKAMLIPDPEKDKSAFFDKLRAMHAATSTADYSEKAEYYRKTEFDIRKEIDTLQSISDTLFTRTAFGLTLQEMYAGSYNIGRDTKDYSLYNAMRTTDIVKENYPDLSDNLQLIADKNLAKFYLNETELVKSNEMVSHILPDLDLHSLKEAQALVRHLIENPIPPFDCSKYPHSRYLTTFYLEKSASDRRDIMRIADAVTSYEHPSLSTWLRASAFPLLWALYPFLKTRYNEYKEDVKIDLNVAKTALDVYSEEYLPLANILDKEGYALLIGGIINGNVHYLNKLSEALSNYVKVRDMINALNALNPKVRLLLDFAYANSDGNLSSMKATLDKLLPIRIYHEIVSMGAMIEPFLTKTVTFDDMRNRILRLKAEQREISRSLANATFGAEYAEYFKTAERSKDYLYDIQKHRGRRPIRQMFDYYDEFLLRLFPCWLLSPEVVSTILPLKRNLFDLVVFDEASQIFIENALPSIYRGSKVVVAGDSKQLRPTAGFVKKYLGDYNGYEDNLDLSTQAALEVESLLDLATARYYPVNLTYHYRSKYAELIDFSNAAFYENRLQIAPNTSKNYVEPPIERIKVNGTWQGRHNHEEAAAVVKLVRNIISHREENETIGIVTFNIEQKEYIEDLLDAEADKVQIFRKQLFNERNRMENGENVGLFVKNLENVQGEERDIIIFSVGYARNDYDKVVAQFGTLSAEGGENRLNVAVTRAKKKVYVVTSIEPEELDRAETTKNLGPKLLKKYLTYARAVSEGNAAEARNVLQTMHRSTAVIAPIGAYEEQIKEELERLGYEVDINLGNTDYKLSLGIFDPELKRYVLGIECDYRAYHSSPSVLERDVYRFKFLEMRGWLIVRVWSRDWWLSRQKVLSDLVAIIERQKSTIKEQINANI